jgi:hypothetical protein
MKDAPHRLLAALCDFLHSEAAAGNLRERAVLDATCAALGHCHSANSVAQPRQLPATDLLGSALASVQLPALVPLCDTISTTAHLFRWRQNPNYTEANMGAAFMAGYGYVEFAGPKEALFHARDIRVGLLLLGPGLHYPLHAHPAEEIYHPLTEGGLWRRGEEGWRAVAAGHAIHHAPMVPHETKATDRALLALYCWRGDTATEAVLTT